MVRRNNPLIKLLSALLKFYKLTLSPILESVLGGSCKYQPTCSVYVHDTYLKYGLIRGSLYSVYRVVRCNPFSNGGYDPA